VSKQPEISRVGVSSMALVSYGVDMSDCILGVLTNAYEIFLNHSGRNVLALKTVCIVEVDLII
jgi:hypothetical protein